ncbi:MAG TPA: helix-turn-helix domain-containing protein [Actinomycetes bacterium]|jgi:hypothetical protein|nr:helix-turn-helix domain-containing protein [Actinomycetes bacterium]
MRSEQHPGGHDQSDDHPEREPLDPVRPRPRPALTISEAAQQCGVSASTIRRHLAAGRFPNAQQRPSPVPGQRGQWRIPADDLLRAGLRPHRRTADHDADDRVRELEHALEVERIRRQAAEDLAAERAHLLQTLEHALQALQVRRAGPANAEPAARPGMLPMVPRQRPPKRELSQEERAAIIGRALSGKPPPKRRWLWR